MTSRGPVRWRPSTVLARGCWAVAAIGAVGLDAVSALAGLAVLILALVVVRPSVLVSVGTAIVTMVISVAAVAVGGYQAGYADRLTILVIALMAYACLAVLRALRTGDRGAANR